MKLGLFLFLLVISRVVLLELTAEGADRSFPCRVRDGANSNLFVMTLGEVKTPISQGLFYPDHDQVKLNDGTSLDHYYRDNLHITYYKPIDKSIFPLPASGWCSWYYYFYEITADEVKKNAAWMAENLKEYGLQYVQLDDGWQGFGRGFGENRDWTTINTRFPDGMEKLAAYIKQLGFKPALWIAPHGQSNTNLVRTKPNAFLLKPDGVSLSRTWEGIFLVDPSTEEGHAHLKDLFTTLSKWGFEYFKIDGQPSVLKEYQRLAAQMKNPSKDPTALYRKSLQTIHEAIGKNRYLLGCWEIALEGAGIVEGWRTGADVVRDWRGFKIALDATMQFYFLHNVVWYCDPDTVIVHNPLTLEQARVWATLQGLTGQALMSSDRMMDLPEARIELYRRIYPAVDIRPLDLFPNTFHKNIWDLKVNHLGRNYDVVGLFNFDEKSKKSIVLNWKELGIPALPVHVYDFWNREYMGVFKGGFSAELYPTSCKVLTLIPATADIQLISTSRHITQGWLDLLNFESKAEGRAFTGRSRVIKNDPYVLSFAFQEGKNFAITKAQAGSLPVKIQNHQGWSTVTVLPVETGEMEWAVTFAPDTWYHHPSQHPGVKVVLTGSDSASVTWGISGLNNVRAFQVWLNGELLGSTKDMSFPLSALSPGKTNVVKVASVWDDGTMSTNAMHSTTFTLDSLMKEKIAVASKKK